VNNLSDFAEFRQVFGEIFQICAKLKDKIRKKCKAQNRINFGKQGGLGEDAIMKYLRLVNN
jgi:hypothetical protein